MSPSSGSSSSTGSGGDFNDLPSSFLGGSLFLPIPPILTSIPTPLTGILTGVGQSFLPFSGVQCKGRRNQELNCEKAEEAGMALKNQYQMLQVQVYDAATKTRSMIEWPAPV